MISGVTSSIGSSQTLCKVLCTGCWNGDLSFRPHKLSLCPATILAEVIFASFEIIKENLLFYFFIYNDLCNAESINLVQKPNGAFLMGYFSLDLVLTFTMVYQLHFAISMTNAIMVAQ